MVCGPLSFDLATDPASVAVKGMPDLPGAEEVAGRADVLVCPGIDTANVLYKMIAALDKYGEASLASITVGFPVPYVILSRSDTLETRLASIAVRRLCPAKTAGFMKDPEKTPTSRGAGRAVHPKPGEHGDE